MDIRVKPNALSGKITAPPSKSVAHRAAICAALASGTSRLAPIEATKDMLATISAAKSLGAKAELANSELNLTGIVDASESAVIDCGESGSTLRFFVPVAAALGIDASFRGHGKLPERPMGELVDVLQNNGVTITKGKEEILHVSGKLRPGSYKIGGSTSSQYVTGLLLALPLLDGDSEIILTSPLESRGYVDITVDVQKRFNINILETPIGWKIPGNQSYIRQEFIVEGDYSNAAFWLCAAALGSEVEVIGLAPGSQQGDKHILALLTCFGAQVQSGLESIIVTRNQCKVFNLDVSQIPDIVPILAVLAAFGDGVSKFYNAGRLRLKESDRITAVAAGLRALGAEVAESSGELIITGQKRLRGGGTIDSFNDHRIAMAMSIAAAYCREPSVISGAECVEKSYPNFYKDFSSLGGIYNVL